MKLQTNEKIKQTIGKYSGTIAVQFQHRILFEPEGWVWLDEDYYLDVGLDVFITGFDDTMIELHTDVALAQLPVINPPDLVPPGGTFF